MNTNPSQPLSNHHAVVTGGGRGIGAAIVRELACLGARITLMGRDAERLAAAWDDLRTEFDQDFHIARVDVTQPEQVQAAFASSRAALGDAHILVNNAGAVETVAFAKSDLDHWRRMVDLNLTGVYLGCREVLPAMLEAGDGRIVNISSTAGVKGFPYTVAYTAAKHGVVGLTRALALEVAKTGVTVNAVCPGYTDTDLVSTAAERVADKTGRSIEDVRQTFMSVNPQGRFVEPGEVASLVAWLCLPAQRSITGQALVIDGGESV